MKKLSKLSREEMKMIMGGDNSGGGEMGLGSCSYTSGNASCTSATGDCKYLYCTLSGRTTAVGICCDGEKYYSSADSGCSGTTSCAASTAG